MAAILARTPALASVRDRHGRHAVDVAAPAIKVSEGGSAVGESTSWNYLYCFFSSIFFRLRSNHFFPHLTSPSIAPIAPLPPHGMR